MSSFTNNNIPYQQISSTEEIDKLSNDLISSNNACKLVSLKGPKAVRLAHLHKHIHDLGFAKHSISLIKNVVPDSSIEDHIFWRFAVIFYIKCFTTGSKRNKIDERKVYKGNISAISKFNFFYSLRNKTLIHDENPFSTSTPSALLNKEGVSPKVHGCLVVGLESDFLLKTNVDILKSLIDIAIQWAEEKSSAIRESIIEDLEKMPYHDLFNMPSPEQHVLYGADYVNKRRSGDF